MSNAIAFKPHDIVAATASSTAAGHDPAYVANDFMGVTWLSASGASSRTLTVDLGADMAFDTLAIFGLTGAQPGWTLKVEAATAAQGSGFPGGSWAGTVDTLLAGADMPTSGLGKALWLAPDVDPPPPSRYVRLTFGSLSNAAVEVARVTIGQRLRLARNFNFGAGFTFRDLGDLNFSPRGVPLRRYGGKLRGLSLTFGNVYRDEVLKKVQPLIERVGNTDTVVIVTNPDPSDERQQLMGFGFLIGDLGVVWARANGFEWRANLVAMDV